MEDQQISKIEKNNAQLTQSIFSDNTLKSGTEQFRAEKRKAFYKGVQALRSKMRSKSK